MIVNVPGGQALLRDKPSVGGVQLVRSEALPFFQLLGDMIGKPADEATKDELEEAMEQLRRRPSPEFARANFRLENAVIVALLRSWTLADPKPTIETVEEMDPAVHAALSKVVAPKVMELIAGTDLSPQGALTKDANGNPVLDEGSPTSPSSASSVGGPEATTLSTDPTGTPSSVTASTSFDSSFT